MSIIFNIALARVPGFHLMDELTAVENAEW
jgi:hypothetical protein